MAAGGKSCEGSRRQRTMLGPHQGLVDFSQLQGELGSESLIDSTSCFLLPSPLRLGRFSISLYLLKGIRRQNVPRGCLEPCVNQSLLTHPNCSQTGCWITLQTQHHCVCDGWVTFPHHPEAVSPTGPMSGGSPPHCTGQAQPPQLEWQESDGLRR